MKFGLLEREPSHGYDLKRHYRSQCGQGRPPRYGQTCATLSRLDRGIVVSDGRVSTLAGAAG